jgi:hypothetical protein
MDFSDLPSEVQYNYLLYNTYYDILNYFKTSKRASSIRGSAHFWNQKALLDFGIPINVITDSYSPEEKYATIMNYYYNNMGSLIIVLINNKMYEKAIELFDLFRPNYEDEVDIKTDILLAAVKSGQPDILETFIKKIKRMAYLSDVYIYIP